MIHMEIDINTSETTCKINGNGALLLTELSSIINELVKMGFPPEAIDVAAKIGKNFGTLEIEKSEEYGREMS